MTFRSLKNVCRTAPHGKVLAAGEKLAVEQGRELARRTLESALQAEAADFEKKKRPRPHLHVRIAPAARRKQAPFRRDIGRNAEAGAGLFSLFAVRGRRISAG